MSFTITNPEFSPEIKSSMACTYVTVYFKYNVNYADGNIYRESRRIFTNTPTGHYLLVSNYAMGIPPSQQDIQEYTGKALHWVSHNLADPLLCERTPINIVLPPTPIDNTVLDLQNQIVVANQLNTVANNTIAALAAKNQALLSQINELNNQIAVQEKYIRNLEDDQNSDQKMIELLKANLQLCKNTLQALSS